MHDATFSDHTTVSMWKFMNSVWHQKWVVWHMNTWPYMFYNFMIILHWIPWKLEEVSCSLPVPRRAPYGVKILVHTVHCRLQ